jgi:hypothetical protein
MWEISVTTKLEKSGVGGNNIDPSCETKILPFKSSIFYFTSNLVLEFVLITPTKFFMFHVDIFCFS